MAETCKAAIRAGALLALAVMTTTFGIGADWNFEPVVELGAEHNDDVLTTTADVEDESDLSYTAAVTLAWRGTSPRSTTSFSYRPSYEGYSDYSELDNTAHVVSLGWEHQASRIWSWAADAIWSRQERARVFFDAPSLDLVALPRTRFDVLRGQVDATVSSGPRTALTLSMSQSRSSYDADEVDLGGEVLVLDDASTTSVALSYEHALSARRRMGVMLDAARNDAGLRGEIDTYSMVGTYGWTGRNDLSVTLRLGAGTTSVRSSGFDTSGNPLPAIDEQTYMVGGIDVRGGISRRATLSAGLDRDVTSGSGVSAPSETLSGYLAYDLRVARFSRIALFGRYAQRDTLDRVDEGIEVYPSSDTTSFRAEYRAALSRTWQMVLAGERFDQSSDSETLDIAYTIYSLSLRWAPATAAGR